MRINTESPEEAKEVIYNTLNSEEFHIWYIKSFCRYKKIPKEEVKENIENIFKINK